MLERITPFARATLGSGRPPLWLLRGPSRTVRTWGPSARAPMASQWGHRARALRPPELVSRAEHCPPQTALGPDAAGRFDTELEGMRLGARIAQPVVRYGLKKAPHASGGTPSSASQWGCPSPSSLPTLHCPQAHSCRPAFLWAEGHASVTPGPCNHCRPGERQELLHRAG